MRTILKLTALLLVSCVLSVSAPSQTMFGSSGPWVVGTEETISLVGYPANTDVSILSTWWNDDLGDWIYNLFETTTDADGVGSVTITVPNTSEITLDDGGTQSMDRWVTAGPTVCMDPEPAVFGDAGPIEAGSTYQICVSGFDGNEPVGIVVSWYHPGYEDWYTITLTIECDSSGAGCTTFVVPVDASQFTVDATGATGSDSYGPVDVTPQIG